MSPNLAERIASYQTKINPHRPAVAGSLKRVVGLTLEAEGYVHQLAVLVKLKHNTGWLMPRL